MSAHIDPPFIIRNETSEGCEIIPHGAVPERVTWKEIEKRANDPAIDLVSQRAYQSALIQKGRFTKDP